MTDWNEGFAIGPIRIASRLVLAPLAGYSDLPFRRVCRDLGAPYCTTEMMLDRCVPIAGRQTIELLATDADDHPVAGQLIGNDPETMAHAARLLQDKGFDAVDINCACPVNKALKRRRGGFLMQEPDTVVRIVRAVVDAVGVPVTLKVRRAFAEADDESCFWRMAAGARDAGAAAITVHARSVEHKYSGRADWDFLKRVKETFHDWTVIGSGDLLTAQSCLDMRSEIGVDGMVAARGVLGNPWLFRQVQDLAAGRPAYQPDLPEQRRVILRHFALAAALYGPRRGAKVMRGHAIRYASMHEHPKKVRMAFVEVRSRDDWQRVLSEFYGGPAEELPGEEPLAPKETT